MRRGEGERDGRGKRRRKKRRGVGGGWIDKPSKTPTSDQFLLLASGVLHANVSVHQHEISLSRKVRRWSYRKVYGWDGSAQHFADTSIRLRCVCAWAWMQQLPSFLKNHHTPLTISFFYQKTPTFNFCHNSTWTPLFCPYSTPPPVTCVCARTV